MSITAVLNGVDVLLAPVGFKRRKRTWNRTSDSFLDVIDIQVSKAGDALTINAGVADPDVYKLCWGTDLPTLVDEPACTVRARVGQLVGDKDVWWPIDDVETAASAVAAVSANVLPFVERMHSRQAMVDFLVVADVWRQKYPPPIMYLAILRNELGDKPGACSLLTRLYETTTGGWRAKIRQVSARLGCS